MIMRFDGHTHTHKSNLEYRDSTNFESDLIDKAIELGLKGIAITDHAVLSSHVDALLHLKEIRKKGIGEDFKLGLGTEIYLVDRQTVAEAREKYEPTRFYHLILIAKNYEGYRALAELSSKSWEESFKYRGVLRIPTYKDYFHEWALKNRGNIIVTTACLGSEFSRLVVDYIKDQTEDNKGKIVSFLSWMYQLFQDDFYIEIQPSKISEEQKAYNNLAIQIAEYYNIKVVINTDAHYLSKDKKEIHSTYLKSQNAERETDEFYSSTYLMDDEELLEYFDYIPKEKFEEFCYNSIQLSEKIEEFDLFRKTEVPHTTIEFIPDQRSILAPLVLSNDKYPYIVKYGTSNEVVDRTLLQQIENGIIKKQIQITPIELNRLNEELEALWLISEKLNQRLSSYYLLTKEIVELIWTVSLVGVSRGSAGAFYICYLLEITQINPLDYDLPYWRHISATRPELPDIDIDSEAGQRANIMEKVKAKYGYYKVLNIGTFKTEGTSSAIQTVCRGMGISTEDASYLSSLSIEGLTVKECLELYGKDKEATFFIKELMTYEGLIENVIEIEGLVCGRSVHASGVYIYNEEYWHYNAMMKAPSGQPITQYDMSCSDYQGGLKLDFLTIESLDRISKCINLLLKDKLIENKGSIKDTYDYYIHPDKLNLKDNIMWTELCKGNILDAFQYDSVQGKSAIFKINPQNFKEVSDGNALMRLSCEGEQPIDRYIRHKKDINVWFKEMRVFGLNSFEIEVMKSHLLNSYGVACTQESVMKLSMDNRIACFDLVLANKLRKAIAKAKAKHLIQEIKDKFFDNGIKGGNREVILSYVWKFCVEPMLGYAFSDPHICGYSLILMQEMNLHTFYSSLHWKVACLCVNSGDINDDISKATDYGALAKAIGGMEKGFVQTPDINKSEVGFKPDIKTNTALYGLGAINGISNELAHQIISMRPFVSIDDFITRAVDTKIVQNSKMYNLIKAGCFDEFETDKVKVMMKFINHIVPDKKKLTSANIPKMIEYRCIPNEYFSDIELFTFKKYVFAKENLSRMINKSSGYYRIPSDAKQYFEKISSTFIEALDYDEEGNEILNSKEFDKIYKKETAEFNEWLKSEDALNRINYCAKAEVWNKYCSGSIPKWEMDSISYYTNEHELDSINISQFFTPENFSELPTKPITYLEENKSNGRMYKKNKLSLIAGTVVEKNKSKSMVTLNTQYGVVEVKLYKTSFSHYDRKTPDEPSWFSRGTKLVVVGYRREGSFIPKIYSDSKYNSSIMKIEQLPSGRIDIKTDREFE